MVFWKINFAVSSLHNTSVSHLSRNMWVERGVTHENIYEINNKEGVSDPQTKKHLNVSLKKSLPFLRWSTIQR
jgi:hypothetical protein